MDSDKAFEEFGQAIQTDPFDLLLARWRRQEFIRKLAKLDEVEEIIPSGSLARNTQVGEIHDLDLIVVFKRQPGWGEGGNSAFEALEYMQERINSQLGDVVHASDIRNHVVRCRNVALGRYVGMPSAPPVDVMPAYRHGSILRVPEQRSHKWVNVNPEKLQRLVAERTREWEYFDDVVKMVKHWAEHSNLNIQGVVIEALVLQCCPRPRFFQTLSVGEAVARFFDKASKISRIVDPTGRHWEMKPASGYFELIGKLKKAAGQARAAVAAERMGEDPSPFWRSLFGSDFPKAKKRHWHPQVTEPLFRPDRSFFGEPAGTWRGTRRPPDGAEPTEPPSGAGPEGGGPWGRGPDGRGPTGSGPPGPGPGGSPWRRPGPAPEGPVPGEPAANGWDEVVGPPRGGPGPAVTFG